MMHHKHQTTLRKRVEWEQPLNKGQFQDFLEKFLQKLEKLLCFKTRKNKTQMTVFQLCKRNDLYSNNKFNFYSSLYLEGLMKTLILHLF